LLPNFLDVRNLSISEHPKILLFFGFRNVPISELSNVLFECDFVKGKFVSFLTRASARVLVIYIRADVQLPILSFTTNL
jgi:hypothetical protein